MTILNVSSYNIYNNSYHENLLPLITDTSFLSNLSIKGKEKILKNFVIDMDFYQFLMFKLTRLYSI